MIQKVLQLKKPCGDKTSIGLFMLFTSKKMSDKNRTGISEFKIPDFPFSLLLQFPTGADFQQQF